MTPRKRRPPDIRPATPADLPVLAAFIRALAAHHGDSATVTEGRLARLFFGPARAATALVAEIDGKPVGFAATVPLVRLQFGERGTEVAHLYVRPEHRGHGIGRALVEAATEAAVTAGHSYIVIGTDRQNRAAQDAYRKMGLEDVPERGPRFFRRLGVAA
jgi:ribosomal protein S18 acetylase RimI-like enzyme